MGETPRAIDLIVQNSTIELFASYGVAAAPVASNEMQSVAPSKQARVGGSIDFRSDGFTGQLGLSITKALALATGSTQGSLCLAEGDWVRELTNQLMGRIKVRVGRFGIHLRTGLPSIRVEDCAQSLRPTPGESLGYALRTLRGTVVVTLVGRFEHSALCYVKAAGAPESADLILF